MSKYSETLIESMLLFLLHRILADRGLSELVLLLNKGGQCLMAIIARH